MWRTDGRTDGFAIARSACCRALETTLLVLVLFTALQRTVWMWLTDMGTTMSIRCHTQNDNTIWPGATFTWSNVSCLLETSFCSRSMCFSSFSIWCSCSRARVPSNSLFSFLNCTQHHAQLTTAFNTHGSYDIHTLQLQLQLHSSTLFSEESCSVMGLSKKMGFQLKSELSATVVWWMEVR